MEFTFLQSPLIVGIFSLVVGGILTFLIQRILNKAGLFTYSVSHYRVGVSADDAIFGTVRATWNDLPVHNLYSSSVELRNESLRDFENVIVKVFSNNTALLTEGTEIVGTTRILEWTTDFTQLTKSVHDIHSYPTRPTALAHVQSIADDIILKAGIR